MRGPCEPVETRLRTPPSEQLLIDAGDAIEAERVLCTSVGRGQAAAHVASVSSAHVSCHMIDLFPISEARELYAGVRNLEFECAADPPSASVDLAVIPVSRFGEAELTRDLLQSAYERLRDGGRLVAAVDNERDTWLRDEFGKLFGKVSPAPMRRGVLYSAVRRGPLKRHRNFRCEFAFRDGTNLVRAVSRPGVFSHRQLDLGARAVLETMEIPQGARVLDIGCGAGVLGLAAATRAPEVSVLAIDSNARAVECAAVGARLNGIEERRFTTLLDAEGRIDEPGTFEIVLANPPYYSHFQIAEIFLQAARKALRPGGRVWVVTKEDHWHQARMGQLFDAVESVPVRGYKVVSGRQR